MRELQEGAAETQLLFEFETGEGGLGGGSRGAAASSKTRRRVLMGQEALIFCGR